jgi:hypothetical protein
MNKAVYVVLSDDKQKHPFSHALLRRTLEWIDINSCRVTELKALYPLVPEALRLGDT